MNQKAFATLAAASAVVLAATAASAQVAVSLPVFEGDAYDGSTVTGVSNPFVTGQSQLGVLLTLDDSSRTIYFDGASIFNSKDVTTNTLTGGEASFGVGTGGEFLYSPSIDGDDGVWGDVGLVEVENRQAPGFPAGVNSTFHSRPMMDDAGNGYWVAGINDGTGSTSTSERVLYRYDRATGSVDVLLRSGDVIDGYTVTSSASNIDFDFRLSNDGTHDMFLFNADGAATTADATLVVDKMFVAQEGSANGTGDNWDNFDAMAISNTGNYVFSGDTDGATTSDEFIAYNGAIAIREGDTVDGFVLESTVDGLAMNDLDQAAFIWDTGPGLTDETLFFATDASNLAGSMAVLTVGDELDTDGDGVADAVLADFNSSGTVGPSLALSNDGMLYMDVDLNDLAGNAIGEGIIGVAVPEPASLGLLGLAGLALVRRRRA